ncbi:hypothetical protein KUL17_18780 [Alteromonas sp. KUL17]|nr:hypothetical protein KUL17_18780 [Alteromonas sp. KUL17]
MRLTSITHNLCWEIKREKRSSFKPNKFALTNCQSCIADLDHDLSVTITDSLDLIGKFKTQFLSNEVFSM